MQFEQTKQGEFKATEERVSVSNTGQKVPVCVYPASRFYSPGSSRIQDGPDTIVSGISGLNGSKN